MQEGQLSPEQERAQELQQKVDKTKDPTPYKEKYENERVQQLSQAVDILTQLQQSAYFDASRVGYEKLAKAKIYIDGLLNQEFEDPEKKK